MTAATQLSQHRSVQTHSVVFVPNRICTTPRTMFMMCTWRIPSQTNHATSNLQSHLITSTTILADGRGDVNYYLMRIPYPIPPLPCPLPQLSSRRPFLSPVRGCSPTPVPPTSRPVPPTCQHPSTC